MILPPISFPQIIVTSTSSFMLISSTSTWVLVVIQCNVLVAFLMHTIAIYINIIDVLTQVLPSGVLGSTNLGPFEFLM